MLSRIQQIGKNNNKDIEEKLNQILEKIEPKIIKISNNTNCYYCNIELENGDIMNQVYYIVYYILNFILIW